MDEFLLLRLPLELRELIYSHTISQPETQMVGLREGSRRTHKQTQRAFLTAKQLNSQEPYLICDHPLSRISRQVHREYSHVLRCFSPISIIARVHNLEFQHVTYFLLTLEGKSLDAFKVREDGTSDRKLIIELHGPYTNSCMENLPSWIDTVHPLAGPERRAELAILYKTIPTPGTDIRAPVPLVLQLSNYHKRCSPGGGEIEAYKIPGDLLCPEKV